MSKTIKFLKLTKMKVVKCNFTLNLEKLQNLNYFLKKKNLLLNTHLQKREKNQSHKKVKVNKYPKRELKKPIIKLKKIIINLNNMLNSLYIILKEDIILKNISLNLIWKK